MKRKTKPQPNDLFKSIGDLGQSPCMKPIMVPLSDLAEINPPRSPIKISPEDIVSFIPMADTTEGGRWINRQSRKYSEVNQGFTSFEEGDVLFAKITPCMENGKAVTLLDLTTPRASALPSFMF